jgi:hypothetical protein
MATYYKSRFLNVPVVYVQEQGMWRSHGPQGVKQGEGAIPEKLFAGLEQISRREAERLMGQGTAEAPAWEIQETRTARREAAGRGGLGSRRSHRVVYAIVGVVLVIAIAVGAVIAFGHLGSATGGSGSTQSASTGETLSGAAAKQVVAKVGGHKITGAELAARTADFAAQYDGKIPDKATDPANYRLFQQDVLDYMVTYQLAVQKAKDLKLTVTDAEVQAEMDAVLKDTYGGDQAKFNAALSEQGVTMEQFRSSYKESALLQKVYGAVTKDVAAPSAAEVSAYYDAHKAQYVSTDTPPKQLTLDEVKGQIASTLLGDKQTQAWQAWIAQQKQAVGVTYGDDWQPAAVTETTTS